MLGPPIHWKSKDTTVASHGDVHRRAQRPNTLLNPAWAVASGSPQTISSKIVIFLHAAELLEKVVRMKDEEIENSQVSRHPYGMPIAKSIVYHTVCNAAWLLIHMHQS